MLQKNLGGGCRSVEEVLQRGVLKSFGGVLGMLHKGCMKDVMPEYYCISYIYICIYIYIYIFFSALPVSRMLLGFGFSGYPGRD